MNPRPPFRRRVLLALAVVAVAALMFPIAVPRPADAGANSWSPMTLPYAMNITALALSPAYPCDRLVFMGTDGHGVYRTQDVGGDPVWTSINNGLADPGVLALAVSPNYGRCDRLTDRGDRTLFVGTRSGVFRSINGGATWEQPTVGLPLNAAVQSIIISPNYASDRTVFAGYEGSLFRSVDGGTTWHAFDAGLTDRSVQSFAISANYANDNTLFVGTRFSGVYRIAAKLQSSGAVTIPGAGATPGPGTPAPPASREMREAPVTVQAHDAEGADVAVRAMTEEELKQVRPPVLPSDRSAGIEPGDVPIAVQEITLQQGARLRLIVWAGAADDSVYAADGAVFTTLPGLVRLKYEVKNIGDIDLNNILITDDNGTPDDRTDDILVNKDAVTTGLPPFGQFVVHRTALVTRDTTFTATVTGYFGPEWAQSVSATDNAIVRVINQRTSASLKLILTAGNSFDGQTYYTVPGPVPMTFTVINDGPEPIRNIVLALDPEGNDGPGCTNVVGTDADETADDVIVGQIAGLGPGQQATVTGGIIVKPETEVIDTSTTFKPKRIQGCASGQVGQSVTPVAIGANDDALVQLVVWQSVTPSNSVLFNLWITSFATSPFYVNDQTIFAGTAYGGLFRSTNSATANPTWELVNQGLEPQWTWVRTIAVSPRYPFDRTIYVGTESGVFRGVEQFTGGPLVWTPMSRGLTAPDVRALGISPDFGRDATLFAGVYGADVYRMHATVTENPWQPYRRVLNGLWGWAVSLTQDGVLLAGTWGRSIGRMVLPTGSDWNYTFPGVPADAEVTTVAVSPGYCTGYTVFAGTWSHGLYRSVDGGASWTPMPYPITYGPVRHVAVAPSYERGHTIALATWGAGVQVSDNDGLTWRPQNSGLPDLKVRAVAFAPAWPADPTMFAVTDTAGLYRFEGGRWVPSGAGLPAAAVMTVALAPTYAADGTMLAGTWGGGISISNDRGRSWRAASGQPNAYVRAVTFSPGYAADGVVYAGTNQGVYRSTDRGNTWHGLGLDSEIGQVDVTGVAVSATDPRTIFVSTGGRGVWQYTETGGQFRKSAAVQRAGEPARAVYTTQDLVYRAFIPLAPKARPNRPC